MPIIPVIKSIVELAKELTPASMNFISIGHNSCAWIPKDGIKDVKIECGRSCGYVEPYGFVPECGCPIHDPNG